MPPNYDKMLVRELKGELEKRKIPIFGTRKTLVNKLKGDDQTGYGLLTVPELNIRMTAEGILDVSGDKSTLKSRMRSKLANSGSYVDLPTDDLHQLCQERGLNHKYVESRSKLIGNLMKSDIVEVPKVPSSNSYSGITNRTSYSPSPSTDSSPVVMTVIGSVIAFMLLLGCIDMMDTEEEEDSYSSSSGGSSSTYTSTPCEELRDVWCYSYSLDMCIYNDSSSGTLYYQEAHWYGC